MCVIENEANGGRIECDRQSESIYSFIPALWVGDQAIVGVNLFMIMDQLL